MSKADSRVAKRYAKALFESCSPKNYDVVCAALNELSSAVNQSEIRNALLNPGISVDQRTKWLSDVFASLCPEEAKSLGNMVSVLIQNRRIDSVPALADYFSELLANYKKLLGLEVVSAKELSQGQKDDLSREVKSRLPSEIAGGVSFEWKTESGLLGGMQVRIGDRILDGSVAGAINKIARQLRS